MKMKSFGEFVQEEISRKAKQEPEAKQASYYQRMAKELKRRLRIRKAKEKLDKAKQELQDAMRQETE